MILRAIDKKRIVTIAKETLKAPLEIWAYGSRVTHQAHECSDLDLVIRTQSKQALDADQLIDFQEALQNSNVPFIVQVFDWERLPESFHENILAHYEVLFSNLEKNDK